MSKVKNPRQKKAKSYALDRRNQYGESPHGARKSIPRGKARAHRAERREVRQALQQADHDRGDLHQGIEAMETVLAETKLQRLEGFKKYPDVALGIVVARNLRRRAVKPD